jgi:sortase A
MTPEKNMNKGKILICIGILLILSSIGITIYNKYEDLNAGKQAQEALTLLKEETKKQDNIVNNLSLNESKEMKTININGDEFIGTITIPTINLELPVMSEYSYDRLKKAPCRYYGNLFTNDLIICAHAYETFFANIN